MSLLAIQVSGYDPGGFTLLEYAIEESRREIAAARPLLPMRANPPPKLSKPDL